MKKLHKSGTIVHFLSSGDAAFVAPCQYDMSALGFMRLLSLFVQSDNCGKIFAFPPPGGSEKGEIVENSVEIV